MGSHKPFRNVLLDWSLSEGRIRGTIQHDQPSACAQKGQVVVTSSVERIYIEDGKRFAETRNSLYMLVESKS